MFALFENLSGTMTAAHQDAAFFVSTYKQCKPLAQKSEVVEIPSRICLNFLNNSECAFLFNVQNI